MKLSPKQVKFLKARAHPLKPVVLMGQSGLTEPFLEELKNTLAIHELIKIKLSVADKSQRNVVVDSIINETDAVKVQLLGNTLTLYRPGDAKKIELP